MRRYVPEEPPFGRGIPMIGDPYSAGPDVWLTYAQEARLKKMEREPGVRVIGHVDGQPVVEQPDGREQRITPLGRLVPMRRAPE